MRERELIGELMDDPSLPAAEHDRALAGLARLNALSRAHAAIASAVMPASPEGRPLRLLDVATGSGDVLSGVVRALERRGVRVEAHACDLSQHAYAAARERLLARGVDAHVFVADATAEGPFPGGPYDCVMNSLFLHHLTADACAAVLARMARSAQRVVVSDLVRTRLGYALALAASRLFTRSRVVHTDALRSVRAAFTPEELAELARCSGLEGARIGRSWPERALLVWDAPGEDHP